MNYLSLNRGRVVKVVILLLLTFVFTSSTSWARLVRTTGVRFVTGLLFDPDYVISSRSGVTNEGYKRQTRQPEEVLRLLDVAKKRGINLHIVAHLRGLDGPGSSLDLPEFQLALTEAGVTELVEIPSTPTLASEFSVTIEFELADKSDRDKIVYVAEDYGIPDEYPYKAEPIIENGEIKGFKVVRWKNSGYEMIYVRSGVLRMNITIDGNIKLITLKQGDVILLSPEVEIEL